MADSAAQGLFAKGTGIVSLHSSSLPWLPVALASTTLHNGPPTSLASSCPSAACLLSISMAPRVAVVLLSMSLLVLCQKHPFSSGMFSTHSLKPFPNNYLFRNNSKHGLNLAVGQALSASSELLHLIFTAAPRGRCHLHFPEG